MPIGPNDNLNDELSTERWAQLLAADELSEETIAALGPENLHRLDRLRGALGAAAQFAHLASQKPDQGRADDIAGAAQRAYQRYLLPQSVQELAVMFTDMAGSTEFAEKTSAEEARAKQKTHNDLLFHLIERHHGTVIKTIGDAIMAIFDRTVDAARCAAQMMRTLFEYNRANHPLDEDRQIHIRAGIHWGKAVVYHELGRLDVTGSAANVAARVESGGDKRTDQVLLSDQAFAQLIPFQDELPCELIGEVTAKGVGMLRLLRLLWNKDDAHVAAEPLRLAAETTQTFTKRMTEARSTRGVHCLFVDPSTRRGSIRPLFVQVVASPEAGIYPRVQCDRVMQAAAARAVEGAFDVLRRIGFPDARAEGHRIEWWIEGPAATYTGASTGLGIALATVAAYTEVGIDVETVVTGAVDGESVAGVAGIAEKWQAVKERGFARMVVPAADLVDLPSPAAEAFELIAVNTVQEAVLRVLGATLGLAHTQLAAATAAAASSRQSIRIAMDVEPAATERKIALVPDFERSWHIGDAIRVRLRPDRDCHLALINIDSSGELTVLLPSSLHSSSLTPGGTEVLFPGAADRFKFKLNGPAGTERLIALAGARPWRLTPGDINQTGPFAKPSLPDWARLAEQLGGELAGMAEMQLFVAERPLNRPQDATARSFSVLDPVASLMTVPALGFRSADGL